MKKIKAKETYRMPDGSETTNAIKMCNAWKRIYNPICKELGLRVIGFDPNILFAYGNLCFDIPTTVAIKICNLIQKSKKRKICSCPNNELISESPSPYDLNAVADLQKKYKDLFFD